MNCKRSLRTARLSFRLKWLFTCPYRWRWPDWSGFLLDKGELKQLVMKRLFLECQVSLHEREHLLRSVTMAVLGRSGVVEAAREEWWPSCLEFFILSVVLRGWSHSTNLLLSRGRLSRSNSWSWDEWSLDWDVTLSTSAVAVHANKKTPF